MFTFILIAVGPIALAVIAAPCIRFLILRTVPPLSARTALLTAIAGGIPALAFVLLRVFGFWFPLVITLDLRFRAMLPLALGIVAVLLLMVPPSSQRTRATAQVSRRTVLSFLSPWWIAGAGVLVAIILALSIAAGVASRPDFEGHYTFYSITLGSMEMGTGIYGWYYSVPALFGLAALVVTASIAWAVIPRTAWNDDLTHDAAVRRLRADNIGRVTCAALLVHLSTVLTSLGGTASLRGSTSTTELGSVATGTPFAALGPALHTSAALTLALGLTLWILTALTAVPVRSRRTSPVRAS
ncbi:hypothetical protein [Microbacterium aurantiacum]|uniref:hypothetical protein n=1 Tax=Microbacterium aurantiacum TaxID=162393 RepID=UPI000C7FAF73|nr:hypothetical protein [Microbacterium aurantiacum]